GGSYLLLFAAEGTAEEIRGTLDPRQDTLYAVVHYPNESRSDGEFLLPKSMRERTCGDFVTLKVPVTPDKVRVATVVLGMNATDVMGVFHPALDRAEEDDLVVFDSIEAGARYRLIFSSKDEGGTLLKVETHRRESSRPSDQRRDRASGSLQLHPDRQENSAKEPAAAPGSAIVRVVADSDPPLDEFDIALIKTDAKVDPRPFMNKHAHFQLPHADVVMGRTRVRQDGDKVRLVGLSPGNYIVNVWADDYVQVGPRCPVTLSKADFQRLQPGVAPPEHAWFVIPAEQFQIQSDREIEIGVRMERLWAIRGRVESAATETTGQNQTTAPLRHVRCRYVGPKGNGPFYPDETGRYHVTGLGAGEVTLFFERDGGKKNEWSRKIVLQVKPGDTYRPAAVEVPLESEPVPERPPAI
ncbi:MAG: hypothetical protein JJ992_14725, partial [Planctomycetes bacterium]|nr:hypothetical protein [Planctomycetota bacterium]